METKTRKSVPVQEEAVRLADEARHPHSPQRKVLEALVGTLPPGELSESAALAALIEAGRAAVSETMLAEGYRAMAAEETEEDRAARAAMRGRSMHGRAR